MNVGEAMKAFQERLDDSMISFVCLDTVICSHLWLSCRCYSVYFTACKPSPSIEQSKESTRIQIKEEGTAGLLPVERAAFYLLSEVGLNIAQPFLVGEISWKSNTLLLFISTHFTEISSFIIKIFGILLKNTINFYWCCGLDRI